MLRLFSPAKINLFLRVVFKRPDGYHHLSSVFQTITLGDTLTIEPHPQEEFTCTDPLLPTDSSNLVLKATELFRRKTALKQNFKIHLTKRIPTQAGLGGGSSNAATTLWACDQLTQSHIPLHLLKQWSAEIGSDIPFFFSQGTAYCTGRGEEVHHLPALAASSLWIVKPASGLATPEVFGRLNFKNILSENEWRNDLDAFLSGFLSGFNDLEKPAFELRPELQQLKIQLLKSGFEKVLMTGSGSSFFCIGQGKLPQQSDLAIFPARFMNRTLSHWYQDPSDQVKTG